MNTKAIRLVCLFAAIGCCGQLHAQVASVQANFLDGQGGTTFDGTTLSIHGQSGLDAVIVSESGFPSGGFTNINFDLTATFETEVASQSGESWGLFDNGQFLLTFDDGLERYELSGNVLSIVAEANQYASNPPHGELWLSVTWEEVNAVLPPNPTGLWDCAGPCWRPCRLTVFLPFANNDLENYDWSAPGPWAGSSGFYSEFTPDNCPLSWPGCAPYGVLDRWVGWCQDYDTFAACVTGPVATKDRAICLSHDADCDGHIDLQEFANFQRRFTWYDCDVVSTVGDDSSSPSATTR